MWLRHTCCIPKSATLIDYCRERQYRRNGLCILKSVLLVDKYPVILHASGSTCFGARQIFEGGDSLSCAQVDDKQMRSFGVFRRAPVGRLLKVKGLLARHVPVYVLTVSVFHRPWLTADAPAGSVKEVKLRYLHIAGAVMRSEALYGYVASLGWLSEADGLPAVAGGEG